MMAFGRNRMPSATSRIAIACAAQRQELSRPAADIDDDGGKQPDHGEQHVAPDHGEQHERRRCKRKERRRDTEPERAARELEREQTEREPVQRGGQQKQACGAGRDRIDQPPDHGHQRRLPVAEFPFLHVFVDVERVAGQVARVEGDDGQRKARCRERRRLRNARRRMRKRGRGLGGVTARGSIRRGSSAAGRPHRNCRAQASVRTRPCAPAIRCRAWNSSAVSRLRPLAMECWRSTPSNTKP